MGEQPLYDFAPLLELMGLGALIALVPLLWVWRRNRGAGPTRYLAALGVLTLFLTFDLVLFGAFTRLTDSGLGCPDWPGCYGSSSPIGALHHITAAETAMPTGPVTLSKAWIEMIHRYLATMVGVLIIALTVLAWRTHRKTPLHGPRHPAWASITLVWVLIQGAFGALTVTMKLFPPSSPCTCSAVWCCWHCCACRPWAISKACATRSPPPLHAACAQRCGRYLH